MAYLRFIKAQKQDKKALKRFYKAQRYSASFIGNDHCYLVCNQDGYLAAVILSELTEHQDHWFLHALVTKTDIQGQGIGSALLNYAQKQHLGVIYCFCQPELFPFYQNHGFNNLNPAKLPHELKVRFNAYQKHQAELGCLILINSN